MKIVIFEDMERSRNLIRDTIQGCIDKNYLDFEIYMVTGDANSLRRTIDELNETAVYFIDIMINGNPVGLEIVDLISGRNKSDFIIVMTAYPEKILFNTEYKLKATSVILKNFKQFKPLYVTQNRLYEEISMTLVYISEVISRASDNGYLIVKNVFKSMLRLPFYNIIFIETYPRNRLKINYDNGEFIFRGMGKYA